MSARTAAGGGRELALAPQPVAPPVGPNDEWFGPGRPLPPIAPPSTAGRRFDYMFGQNLQVTPRWDQPVSFQQLRALADNHDLTRLAIETRKDQMSRLTWTFGIVDSDDDLTPEQDARAKKYRQMLRRPDGENFWHDWLRMLLEDLLVIDAPSVFVRRTLDGEDVVGLCQVDGSTIKPIVDAGGRTPQPPEAAYQQVLHGMPAVNYTTRQLVYRPRNKRVHTVWGFSPVEQIVATVHIALRRQIWQHAYFTDGNVPDSLIGVPGTWSPDQIRDFQAWFDGMLTGNTQRRRGALFVPGEVAKSYVPTKDAEMFGAAEEWFARLVCYCFGLPHQALVKEVNRATADNAREQAIEDGLAPIMGWVKNVIDGILIDQLGEAELEFRWVDDKEMDPKVQDEIWAGRVDRGMADRNEWRTAVGMEPRPEPEASKLMASGLNAPSPIALGDQIDDQRERQESGVFPTPPKPGEGDDEEGDKPKPDDEAAADEKPNDDPEKVAKALRRKATNYRRIGLTRRVAERQRVKLQGVIARGLKRIGGRVVAAVEAAVGTSEKAASDDREHLIQIALEALGSWDFLIDPTQEILEAIAEDSIRAAAAMIGPAMSDELVDQVSETAVRMAQERAAELVGKRVLENGDIVDNPDLQWAISEDTRQMIRDTITRVLDENQGSRALIDELQEAHAFSASRAETISRTEIANANSRAAMESYVAARDAGVSVKKEWLLGPNSCDICQENADAGPIDLDEAFPSGDSEPGAHPNCVCAVGPVVDDESGGGEE